MAHCVKKLKKDLKGKLGIQHPEIYKLNKISRKEGKKLVVLFKKEQYKNITLELP